MNAIFERREELAPLIWQYYLRTERPYPFTPGQYAVLYILSPLSDPRGSSRTFTLTSLPGDELISFVVKFIAPLSPYKQVLQALMPGDKLRIDEAMGDLVLPKSPARPLVFIAGGIGMASYAGMLQQLINTKDERAIFLFYALRSRREHLFKDLIKQYPLQLAQFVYAPNQLTAREIVDSTPPDALLYLSGSQKFVESLRIEFEAGDIPRSQIVFDYYDGYTEL